ncbi:MAG: hypothetical protein AB8U44_03610, partial [Aaplasma endosymbiont of Hyalomma asiaticum]
LIRRALLTPELQTPDYEDKAVDQREKYLSSFSGNEFQPVYHINNCICYVDNSEGNAKILQAFSCH